MYTRSFTIDWIRRIVRRILESPKLAVTIGEVYQPKLSTTAIHSGTGIRAAWACFWVESEEKQSSTVYVFFWNGCKGLVDKTKQI